MNEVLKKLKLAAQTPVLIMNAPDEYINIMKDIEGTIHTSIKGKYKFIQLFVKSIDEANEYIKDVVESLDGDGYLWMCYPKKTSKKYKSDLNRDTHLEVVAPYHFQGVSLVSIDADWSAFRIRNIKYIKSK